VEVLAGGFVRRMREQGHELLVITGRDEDSSSGESDYHGTPVHTFPFWPAVAERDLDQMLRLRRQVAALKRKFRPDLVHVNHPNIGVIFHRQTAAAHPAPELVTLHGIHRDSSYGPEALYGQLLRAAGWVVACSSVVLYETRRQVPELSPRSSVIHSSLDLPAITPAPFRFDPPRFLCVGRLSPEKGFDIALRAFASLADRFPAARLGVAGDGPERSPLQQLAAGLSIANRVDFLGWVPPDDVPALISSATAVVVPSRSESLGLVAVQAAQMARPVVATRVGGLLEVVADGETGLLVRPNDSDSLADALAELLQDPARATQLGEIARRRVTARFSWQRHIDGYNALYEKLVQGT
jgi:glycogen(starch) synthase